MNANDYRISRRTFVGSLAAVGIAKIEVYQRPRVGILSTGNEIVEPGRPLGPGQIYDINRFTISAVVSEERYTQSVSTRGVSGGGALKSDVLVGNAGGGGGVGVGGL